MDHQRCEDCMCWCKTPSEEKSGCHLFPPFRPRYVGPRIGPLAANKTAADLTWVAWVPSSPPDGWCRHWEPRPRTDVGVQ